MVQLNSVQENSAIWFLQLRDLAEILKHSGNMAAYTLKSHGVTKNCSKVKISYIICFNGEYMRFILNVLRLYRKA